ncbi:ethanolamine ammonia-lyase reactivating factor EutA [Olivibacter sitiensis]|uniref:Ppx/GppA phosphatase family protein n=1 Tax=Olivibacter sitiensis TaxID=376470 RepID=UPI0003F6A12D|nr:ethanolamine ammonia-lyase reactivating factor EutA [Olivibacter sitiensis]
MRYGAIDIGSNAIRLLIAEKQKESDGRFGFTKNTLLRIPLRLGKDAFTKKYISDEKADALLKSMQAFRNLMDVFEVGPYMACATSAMREAKNGVYLVKKIADLGINLEIIDGAREAEIIYSSHVEERLEKGKNYLYIDVGGGSTELSLFEKGKLIDACSFNLGTIRILDGQDKKETWESMKQWVKGYKKQIGDFVAIGTGGNINKLKSMANLKPGNPISYIKLRKQYEFIKEHSLQERIDILGLKPDRADVIVPACTIFLQAMRWGRAKQIIVPQVGLVDGIIQLLLDEEYKKAK